VVLEFRTLPCRSERVTVVPRELAEATDTLERGARAEAGCAMDFPT
jgi:hypothetical protein